MFGDWSWLGHRTETQQERFSKWLNELDKSSAKLAVVELGACAQGNPRLRLVGKGGALCVGLRKSFGLRKKEGSSKSLSRARTFRSSTTRC